VAVVGGGVLDGLEASYAAEGRAPSSEGQQQQLGRHWGDPDGSELLVLLSEASSTRITVGSDGLRIIIGPGGGATTIGGRGGPGLVHT
jgi:hypothetical protein